MFMLPFSCQMDKRDARTVNSRDRINEFSAVVAIAAAAAGVLAVLWPDPVTMGVAAAGAVAWAAARAAVSAAVKEAASAEAEEAEIPKE